MAYLNVFGSYNYRDHDDPRLRFPSFPFFQWIAVIRALMPAVATVAEWRL